MAKIALVYKVVVDLTKVWFWMRHLKIVLFLFCPSSDTEWAAGVGGQGAGEKNKKNQIEIFNTYTFYRILYVKNDGGILISHVFKFTSHLDFVCFVYKHCVEGKLEMGGNELMVGHVCALQQMYFNSYGRPGTLNFFSFFKYFIF